MASSTSSLSRHRPVILIVTGAAAAFAAYCLYSALQAPPPGGLHRRNAQRRPPRRSQHRRRTLSEPPDVHELQRLIGEAIPQLGTVQFLGNPIALDSIPLPSTAELRDIAGSDVNPEHVIDAIDSVHGSFIIRLLSRIFPDRPMSSEERRSFDYALQTRGLAPETISRAMRRFDDAVSNADRYQGTHDRESNAGTELSWHTSHESGEDQISENGQTLRRTLYHIAEDSARQKGVKHRGVSCDQCDAKPIRGIRWRCVNCADFDLCSDCEATNSHTKTHIFYKIRVPAPYLGLPKQAPVYPGRPNMMSPSIDSGLKRRMITETNIDAEEIEALWDQFTCLADTEWRDDPNNIGWAIDRRSFNQAFIPRYSTFTSAPNLVYDRVFAYYDSNNDGKIGYEEFVKGLDGMHSSDPAVKLKIVFNGYDIDGDGYISRKDVLRLFRAYYAIEKEGTRNYIAESTDELSVAGALDVINSGQPLASQFTQSSVSSPRNRRLQGKLADQFGDLRSPFHGAVLDDTDDTADREDVLGVATPYLQYRHADTREIPHPQEEIRQETVRERWRRRRFYVDEEEGLNQPEGHLESEDPSDEEEHNSIGSPNGHQDSNRTNIPRGSRSSSRVRFQDDLDIETRSNASTSSRPFGERWGGYEIPEPEKDLGKELFYQITQQAFNELLDPLFLEKENLAMEAFDTRQERRKHRSALDRVAATFDAETQMQVNHSIWSLGSHGYSRRMVELIVATECIGFFLQEVKDGKHTYTSADSKLDKIISSVEVQLVDSLQPLNDTYSPSVQKLWTVKIWRLQFHHELSTTIINMVVKCGWLQLGDAEKMNGDLDFTKSEVEDEESSAAEHLSERVSTSEQRSSPDLTLPQFRPNSELPEEATPQLQINTRNQQAYQDPTMPQFRPNSFADINTTATTRPGSSTEATIESPLSPTSQLSEYTTPDEDDDSDTDDNTEFVYQADTGPFFIDPADTLIVDETNVSQYKQLTNALPTTAESIHIALETPARETARLTPVRFRFSFDPNTLILSAHPYAFEEPHNPRVRFDITSALRRSATLPSSPCYLARLANLDAVEKEIQERKGQGLISLDEFATLEQQDGNLRFLNAWMDWVNF